MIWAIPKIWKDADVYIIGGGFSITEQFHIPKNVIDKVKKKELSISAYSPYLSFLHDTHVIGVNASLYLGDWIDFNFFGDLGFWEKNRTQLKAHPAPAITCHAQFENKDGMTRGSGVKYVPQDLQHREGISTRIHPHISWNGNSGAAAINLAYHLGAKRIFLLGFDMRMVNQQSHWHSEYPKSPQGSQPYGIHLRGFPAIKQDAAILNLKIYNVSPESALKEFPRITFEDMVKLTESK